MLVEPLLFRLELDFEDRCEAVSVLEEDELVFPKTKAKAKEPAQRGARKTGLNFIIRRILRSNALDLFNCR